MRVFISHGTDRDKPAELQFLDDLERALRGPVPGAQSCDVLLDRTRLAAGDEWSDILHDWLAECQASVLLLSARALDRPWVLKEATILSFRRERDHGFPLIPVLLPGVDWAQVANRPGLAALALDKWQATLPGASAAEVAAIVRAKLAGLLPTSLTPLDRLQSVLENRICHANATAIEQVCEDLLGEQIVWTVETDRQRQRARVFARAIARGRLGRLSLPGVAKSLSAAALAKEHVQKVIDLAASVWVDEEVAARLRAAADGRAGASRVVALNNESKHGATMTVWRAQLPDIGDNIYFVAGGGSDDLENELPQRICSAYYEANRDRLDDFDDAQDMLGLQSEPIFIVLPPPIPDEALLQQLHVMCPKAVFILQTPDACVADLPPYISALRPGLSPVLEKQNKADYLAAHRSFR